MKIKSVLAAALLIFALAASLSWFVGTTAPNPETPTVNLPPALRQRNYPGMRGGHLEGSCPWAAMISLLTWQHRDAMADYVRHHLAASATTEQVIDTLEALGVRYSYTTTGDVAWLEWACATRRGAAVGVRANDLPKLGAAYKVSAGPRAGHILDIVYLDGDRVGLLDNNDVSRIYYVDRATFLECWEAAGGFAITPVYTPAPPIPQ